jgi:hypothetical protein
MPTITPIPDVSYQTRFGNVGKVVWFDVTNNYNYFELYFSVLLQQFRDTSLQLYNSDTNQIVWSNIYPSDVNQETLFDSIRVLHITTTNNEQPFGIINIPT